MAQHYKNESITKSRVETFLGWENFNTKGNFPHNRKDQNLLSRVWTTRSRNAIQVSVATQTPLLQNPTADYLASLPFRPAKLGDKFGPTFSNHIFKLDITIPVNMQGSFVHLLWDSNSEAIVLSREGVPRQGLVGGDHLARRADYQLLEGLAKGGEEMTLYVEVACNGLFGAGRGGDIEPPDMDRYYELEECCLAVFDSNAWELLHDVTLLSGLAKVLPEKARRMRALQVANEVVNAVELDESGSYLRGREVARAYLGESNGEGQAEVHAMLHSHIDLAWLWPMAATPAKGVRTFSTQLRLMEMYEDCIFVQSQAQLYEWVKEMYPVLWKEVCQRVKEGRFVPIGGTWVEMDCNIPCGESLVRQFLMGQGFFEMEFGKRCREFWLPDTFGYAAQLPQIMIGCGIDRFLTQKLSWNSFNKFPHSTFVWEGLDGSRVLAHMPPADTYNAQASPDEVLRTAHENKDASVMNCAIMLVGHGDGGGGASPAMLESMKRMRDLDGTPKVRFSTPDYFFEQVEKMKHSLPRWVGELYFELHRGTYTSQARTKQNNRRCEILLRDLEIISSFALVLASSAGQQFDYPHEVLKSCWRLVLKNCFHDTLPGSCISQVYRETFRDYHHVKQKCQEAIDLAFASLGQSLNANVGESSPAHKRIKAEDGNPLSISAITNGSQEPSKPVALLNSSTGWQTLKDRPLIVEIPAPLNVLGDNTSSQVVRIGVANSTLENEGFSDQQKYTLAALHSRPKGVGIISNPNFMTTDEVEDILKPAQIEPREGTDGVDYLMSNGLCEARVSSSGRLKSLLLFSSWKAGRETLAQVSKEIDVGSEGGNCLVIFDDVSRFWCGWDTEVYSYEKQYEVGAAESCEIVDRGPLQVSLYLKYPATKAGSIIEQYIVLRAESARLDFRTQINWRESRKVLRVLFNTQVRALHASYDSQFGFIRRPTTFNNSWDIAKFEVVGHQYCDISEHNFGVALLNDCKYGYSVRDSTMRLSLLRAPKSPDDTADIGVHTMTYAILPHWNSFPTRAVIEEAAHLNSPPILHALYSEVESDFNVPDMESMFEMVENAERCYLDSVLISAVKQAEKSPNNIIVRLFEAMGARGVAVLRCPQGMDVKKIRSTNMLEDEILVEGDDSRSDFVVDRSGNSAEIAITFNPFHIRTVMIECY